ncbi:MAG: SpoIIE family protein phosphatase [Spirochaetales bacterium]|nr:SpoIIE family protein phosphatase [Spirochaetales bacterium]
MSVRKNSTRRILAALATGACFLALAGSGSAAVPDQYWELARVLVQRQASFPTVLESGDEALILWQESRATESGGEAWISLERHARGGAVTASLARFAGPFRWNGTEPVLYSAAASGTTVVVAGTALENEVTVWRSSDSGTSFDAPSSVRSAWPVVAPRLFARADGGWLLFATAGGSSAEANGDVALPGTTAEAGVPEGDARDIVSQSLRLVMARSDDGVTWTEFTPFVDQTDGLLLSFLPSAASVPGSGLDVVAFQSLVAGDRPTFQIFTKTSADGGLSWSRAVRITDFEEPVPQARRDPASFDNQRAHLAAIGGRLSLVWERRPLSGQTQAYYAELDGSGEYLGGSAERVTLGQGSVGEPRLVELGGEAAVIWYDDRRGDNRVHLASRSGLDWRDRDISGAYPGAIARGAAVGGRLWATWQTESESPRVVVLEPDTRALPPNPSGVDFTSGVPSRRESVSVRWSAPADPSGIEGYAWSWSQDPSALPPETVMAIEAGTRSGFEATADGAWYFAIRALDFAGNWSEPARTRFVRDRTPPSVPLIATPDAGGDGFLLSNTFELSWDPPPEPDTREYVWNLRWIGPLDKVPPRRLPASAAGIETAGELASPSEAAPPRPPAESVFYAFGPATDYERSLVEAAGVPTPDLGTRTEARSLSFRNVEDGYYVFAVSAVDAVGNVGDTVWTLLRADKFQPYTVVSDVVATRDAFGKASLRILGRGFLEDGAVRRVVLDLDGREPWDREYLPGTGGVRVDSDRVISGVEAADLDEGVYRVGVLHPVRGWAFSAPRVAFDAAGSIKFGDFASTWKPSWKAQPEPKRFVLSIPDLALLSAFIFALAGIVLTSRATLRVVAEGGALRREIIALVEGSPMQLAEPRAAARRKLRTQGPGLRVKFTLTISLLVLSVVVLLAAPLAFFVTATERASLASGLEQRARVLLESVAQGARSNLPGRNLIELGQLPQQARALDEARYVTITAYGTGASASPDTVWASNDPGILDKIDTAELAAGVSVLEDPVSSIVEAAAKDIDAAAAAEVGALSESIASLQAEARALAARLDAASQARVAELGAAARDLELTLTEKLGAIAEASVGSTPRFDPAAVSGETRTFIFWKPILFRQGNDGRFFRGMVRLELGTEIILADIRRAQQGLFAIIGGVALVALGIGIVGAIILSNIIVNPIRRLVEKIEEIRDTEDKSKLEGFRIGIKSRDELSILAGTVEDMTHGLVKAAAAAKDLTVGKETQKMFIPLERNAQGNKLTTLKQSAPGLEAFGYYEGAKGVSGDYFTFEKLDERHWAFIKCDVAGKGVPAALIMVEVATIFLDFWAGWTPARGIKLAELCYRVNDLVEGRGFKGRFAAFVTGVVDARSGVVEVAHAGDKFLHVFDGAAGKMITRELPDAPAAGSFPNFMVEMKTPFTQTRLTLNPHDALMLYTDGLEEAQRAIRGQKFEPLFEKVEVRNADGTTSIQDQPRIEFFSPEDGPFRVADVSAAVMARGRYTLERAENPVPGELLSFDFSGCEGSVEDLVLALASVEKIFRVVPDPATPKGDFILVDAKIDAFLEAHFDQYRLYARDKRANPDADKPEYVAWYGLSEDGQYDDLTVLCIEKK